MIRVILADDHTLIRAGTQHILKQYPDLEVIGEAEDGQRALELIKEFLPDIAILDISMPKLSGIDVLRHMKYISPGTKALMLTAHDDDASILAAIEAGAAGYLLKTVHEKDLIDSIRLVYSGEPVLHPTIAKKMALRWSQCNPSRQGLLEQLSPRELAVLELAATGLRSKAIAGKLGISARTVEWHFNGIFTKLGVSSRIEAVLEATNLHLLKINEKA